jgi:uncharacterized membrane protein YfcA
MAVVDAARTESRPVVPLWRLLTVGLVGGALSGLLGIGGGTVMVPLLVLWVGINQRLAHAVSLGAIIPISVVAIGAYGVAGAVDWRLAVALIAGSLLGARAGAGLLSRLSEPTLKLLFGGFLLVAAAMILAKR